MNLEFKITEHLEKLAKKSKAIRKQFYPSKKELKNQGKTLDPLKEEKYSPVKGLIQRYSNRVLILLTLNCAAYCRFCFRRRIVSDIQKGFLTETDLNQIINYIKKHPQVNEIIISGGDPLTQPKLLELLLKKIVKLKQIKIIRIGTRLMVSDPQQINSNILRILKLVKKQPLYLLLHFEHPDELTKETIKAIKKLRSTGAILLSQSVFLKGINDNVVTLEKLFTELLSLGIKPYYILHNDEPLGTKHFTVDFKKERKIMTALRKRISGLAYPAYVYDQPEGPCKVPLPLDFDYSFMKK
ncbi:MAG: KamA family radical SAM protein [Parcubacteria group bacterium]|nr:KamA family radical SAM protein [Parcubacteria group bacterium]